MNSRIVDEQNETNEKATRSSFRVWQREIKVEGECQRKGKQGEKV